MKEILDIIHKTMYQFFDVCGEDEECNISDKDELLLEVNKAICTNLKALEQKEPFINKPCVAWGVCHEDKMKVLEKIKAEIENIKKVKKDLLVTCGDEYTKTMMKSEILGIETVLLVVDKYIAESEDENDSSRSD